jgi:hypothetical protein
MQLQQKKNLPGEVNEAAEILLAYKLGEELNEGQIEQIHYVN